MGRGRAKTKSQWPDDDVIVPDLRGMTAAEAGQMGTQVGLRVVGVAPHVGSLSELAGTVIHQRPDVGAAVARGTELTVWTSGPGGDAGVREPRRPLPPLLENRATAERR